MITFGIWQLDYTNMLDMRSIMIYVYVESEFLRFVKFRFFDLLDKFKGKIYEDLLYRYHFFSNLKLSFIACTKIMYNSN